MNTQPNFMSNTTADDATEEKEKTMEWNSETGRYEGQTYEGRWIAVDRDEYAEGERRGMSQKDLASPSVWENCIGNPNIYYIDEEEN
jgi:hypothetical protein